MNVRALFASSLIVTVLVMCKQASAQTPARSWIGDESQRIRALESDLENARLELKTLREKFGDGQPKVEAAENNVKRIENRLQALQPMLRIYPLRYVPAVESSALFREFFGDRPSFRVAVDQRLNSLIVNAPAKTQEELAAILQAMDVESKQEPEVRVFRLTAKGAAQKAIDKLKELTQVKSWSATTSATGGTELTVTSVSAEKMQQIDTVLKQIEEQARPKSRQVRVVWLVNDLADPKPVPDDMKPVITELEKFDVTKMSVAAQTSVRTLGRFSISSVSTLEPGTESTRLVVEGELHVDTLDISLQALRAREELARISTSINAPLGHPVVLGISPINAKTSVFVVTVYDGQ